MDKIIKIYWLNLFRKLATALFGCFIYIVPHAQSVNQNYVATWTATAPDPNPNDLVTRPLTDSKLSINYFDGLGRLMQSVSKQGSLETGGVNADLVQPMVYDVYGREAQHFLPYASPSADGSYKSAATTEQPVFYNNSTARPGIGYPYSPIAGQGETNFIGQTVFEASPLNRPTDNYAPGNNWAGTIGQTGTANHGVHIGNWTNTALDAVRIWNVAINTTPGNGNFSSYFSQGAYPAGSLYKSVTTDEAGHQSIEFKDINGHVILKKVQISGATDNGAGLSDYTGWACTYYIYDVFGLLRAVIQPAGVAAIAGNWFINVPSTVLPQQCFRYEYDARNRMVMKQVPGAQPVYMVYDNIDRLVMTQDGNLRAANKWMATIYDLIDRPVETGILAGTGGDFNIQLSNAYNSTSYPTTGSLNEVLTITHYDDYVGLPSGLASTMLSNWNNNFITASNTVFPYPVMPTQTSASSTIGLITWTQAEVMSSTNFQNTVNIYDDWGRVIQNTTNSSLTGINTTNTVQYTWTGQPLVSVQAQTNTATSNQTAVVSLFTYDALNRVVRTQKQISNNQVNSGGLSSSVTTAINQYDALGHLKYKLLGDKTTAVATYSTVPLEAQQFDYNIRGWLLGLNRAYVWSGSSVNSSATQDATTSTGEAYTGPKSTIFLALNWAMINKKVTSLLYRAVLDYLLFMPMHSLMAIFRVWFGNLPTISAYANMIIHTMQLTA